jgi:hypothetical protein
MAELSASNSFDVSSIAASPVRGAVETMAGFDFATSTMLQCFIHELRAAPPAFQRLHLRMFAERLGPFAEHLGPDKTLVPDCDWEGLLIALLAIMKRRGGLTPLQAAIHDETSDTAYRILHRLTCTLHPSLPRVRAAYLAVLGALDHTIERIVNPDAFAAIEAAPTSPLHDYDTAMTEEISALRDEAVRAMAEEDQLLNAPFEALSADKVADFGADPHWYSVDCLPMGAAGILTEEEFQITEAWFADLDQIAPGRYAVTAGVKKGGGVMGCRWLGPQALADWSRLFPDGTAGLADVLRFLFPDTPVHVVQLRIEGSTLGVDPAAPAPTVPTDLRRPSAGKAAKQALDVLFTSNPTPRNYDERTTHAAVMFLRKLFDAADFHGTGLVSLPAARCLLGDDLQSGPIDLLAVFAAAEQRKAARDGAPALVSFPVFVELALGAANREKMLDDATRACKWAERDRVAMMRRETDAYTQRLAAGGVKQLKRLTVPQRIMLRERNAALASETTRRHEVVLKRAVREASLRGRIDELKELKARRDRHDQDIDRKNVPTVFGPTPPPPTFRHGVSSHVEVTHSLFDLSAFVADPAYRVDTIGWLKALDLLGLHPDLFLSAPHCAAHYLGHRFSHPARPFRDAAVASKRPAGTGFWTGDQALQVKTNLNRRSGTKYELIIQGYNPGVAAPVHVIVVGYATMGLPEPGSMERYGWPDGWDQHSIVRLAPGCAARQYLTRDGYVCVELRAKSLSQIGFTVSCLALSPGHCADDFAASVYHTSVRL